ncbi:MAG: hypothetical protein A2277_13235 [Desulfobacterales bacterium RIFOXYA12_FULL_46_15]|nr:MAG: hypothetical protein A2097_04330 [Desulfobacula sp. GWF2_41_7]OGR27628.1 MAG: hypothetical protein A2277_13235 [Desulfobacterales bacterium RIFOXYA12_FULL_46_15]
MNKKKYLVCLFIILIPFSGYCRDPINIVTDSAYWYPYTYSEDNQAKGIHIDMVQKALANLNHTRNFHPRPWKRALDGMKNGEFDAVVSASYKPERAGYLLFPDDAATCVKSMWRITQVEYVVITNPDESYTFEGDLNTIPQPVRAPLGYSIADTLRAAGVAVLEAPDIIDCVIQLVSSKRGAFITPPENAMGLQLDDRFRGRLKIHLKPIESKSYYMAFSKKNQTLLFEEIKAIWDEIARLRENEPFMKSLFDKYQGKP